MIFDHGAVNTFHLDLQVIKFQLIYPIQILNIYSTREVSERRIKKKYKFVAKELVGKLI